MPSLHVLARELILQGIRGKNRRTLLGPTGTNTGIIFPMIRVFSSIFSSVYRLFRIESTSFPFGKYCGHENCHDVTRSEEGVWRKKSVNVIKESDFNLLRIFSRIIVTKQSNMFVFFFSRFPISF